MRRTFFGLAMVAVAAASLTASASARAQEAAPDLGFELPKAGPEHEILKSEEGVWDAKVEMWMAPGTEPEVSVGVETNTLIADGLWRVQDFRGEMMGLPYHGHCITGFDASKGKYVGTWIDSMAPGLSNVEGTYDAETRTLTSTIVGPCPTGLMMTFRSTTEYRTDGTRVTTMYSPEGQGEEFVMMKITYTRRPADATASR